MFLEERCLKDGDEPKIEEFDEEKGPLCATTEVSRAVKVPQIQFIAGFCGHSATETGTHSSSCAASSRVRLYGGGAIDEVFFLVLGHFSRSRCLELSAPGVAGTPGVLTLRRSATLWT